MRNSTPDVDYIYIRRSAMRALQEIPPDPEEARLTLEEMRKLVEYTEGRALADDEDECPAGRSGNVIQFPKGGRAGH